MSSPSFELKTEIVRAGAGAGKTTRLTNQVLDVVSHFVRTHKRYPHLVVTTFTRKATQELRERLMLEAVQRGDLALLEYVSSKSFLSISTIHGVLSLFLSRFAPHLDMDPSFRLLSPAEIRKESKRVLRKLLVENEAGQSLLEAYRFDDLNELCLEYFDWKSFYPEMTPYSVSDCETQAKRWASKLAQECRKVAALISAETSTDKWLEFAQVFSDVAADLTAGSWAEIREKVQNRLGGIRKPARTQKNPGITDGTHTRLEALREELKSLSDERYNPELWQASADFQEQFRQIAEPFCEQLKTQKYRMGHLQMADLELSSLEVIRKYPHLAGSFAAEWDYWLIDEYQDTSPIQVEILRHLIGAKPHFVVGDPQQSIYLFRGARMEVFAQKEIEVQKGDGLQNYLKRNYRSKPELLLFFNDLFEGVNSNFQAMDPKTPPTSKDEKVAVFAMAEDAKDSGPLTPELQAVSEHVQKLLNSGVSPEQICILGRANRHLNEISRALQSYQIATQVHAASGFYERREIRDALALLKFLVHPHDNVNLVELLRSPWFRVEDEELVRLAVGNEQSLWANLLRKATDDTLRVVEQLKAWMTETQICGVSATLTKALVQHGYFDFSHHHDPTGRREANLWKLITRLRTEEAQPGFSYLNFISNNLMDLRNSEGSEESDATPALAPNRVNLMTVHASKGLQFEHVLVPFAGKRPQTTKSNHFVIDEEQRKWSISVFSELDEKLSQPWLGHLQILKMRERELAESDRVFYVALTRAKNSVFLSWTGRPESGSWADRIKLDLTSGVHQKDYYRYEVQTGPWHPSIQPRSHKEEILIREPFLAGLVTQPALSDERNPFLKVHYQSVTELLDDQHRQKEMSHLQVQQARIDGAVPLKKPGSTERDLNRVLVRIQRSVEGTLAHQLFELMKYQKDVNPATSRLFEGRELEVGRALEYVQTLKEPAILDLLRDGQAEWGFVIQEGTTILEGQIDLWGRDRSGQVWIIDYKTGNPTALEKAFSQLQIYSFALRRSGQIDPTAEIRLAVVYPFHQKVYTQVAETGDEVKRKFRI